MSERIIVCDDERAIREGLADFLSSEGFVVEMAADGLEAIELLSQGDCAVLLCDLKMPGADGLEVLHRAREQSPETAVVIITAFATVETAVRSLTMGAQDYLIKPLIFEDILSRVNKLMRYRALRRENEVLRQELNQRAPSHELVGKSAAMQQVRSLIEKVGPTGSTVLITGASGTGKEVVARALHQASPRADKLFMAVNLCAVPEALVAAQLFGHVKGAFTGALVPNEGLFRAARGGTVFLDEIAELPPALQSKLLRVLERKEVLAVGATRSEIVDVRILSATNRELKQLVEQGAYREDLYFRLNVIEIQLPTLAERREDIPELVAHCLCKLRRNLAREIEGVSSEALRLLMVHEWKGNVRELENVLERAVILGRGSRIEAEDLPPALLGRRVLTPATRDLRSAIKAYERQHIELVLDAHDGDRKGAARELGLALSSLYRKIDELGLK